MIGPHDPDAAPADAERLRFAMREGELDSVSRTAARLNLPRLSILPHRTISAVRVENRASTVLELQRLRLPAPKR